MRINKNIINTARKYPIIANLGYSSLKKYWSIKANFQAYQYPDDISKASVEKKLIIDFNKNRPYGPKQKICYAPFNNLHFQTNGDVSACSFNYDFILGNVNKNTIREIWEGAAANEFREKLGNYDFEFCKSCEHVLQAKNYSSFPPLKYDMYADDQTSYPNQMSFEMSNLCNFECVMCNENFSSLIRKRKGLEPLKFNYPERFFEELQEFLPHLKSATFIGGEPLLIKAYFRIWEDILRLNKNCIIHIQTNASYLPPRFLEMLETGQFDVGISLDATTKEIFESIRINSNFEEIQENIKILKNFMDRGKVNLNINFCPMTNNRNEIPKILHYCNELSIPLKLVNLENPRNLSLHHRNKNFLKVLITSLEKEMPDDSKNIIKSKNNDSYKQFIGQLKYLLKKAEEREAFFHEHKKEISERFKILFQESNLYNHFNKEQRNNSHEELTKYIGSFTDEEDLIIRTKFRIYYTLFRFKNSFKGESATNFEYGLSILKDMAKEFFLLEQEEQNYLH